MCRCVRVRVGVACSRAFPVWGLGVPVFEQSPCVSVEMSLLVFDTGGSKRTGAGALEKGFRVSSWCLQALGCGCTFTLWGSPGAEVGVGHL